MADDDPTRRADTDDLLTVRGLKAGQKAFGRYVLETELGVGGMGVVWRARDEELGELVALKFLSEAVARDDAAVDELKDETRRARRLTHPNIVRIHQFERESAMAAVSMELVDGLTLTKLRLAQQGKVFVVEALAPLVSQLCAALDYAHGQAKIVHRDLKPANILVTRDGVVKVTDFGIARSLSESSTRLTGKGGDTSGTIPYMSPQQLRGRKPRATDDLYSLGATLYELLTGKPPFFRGDPYSLRMQILEDAPLPLAQQREEMGVRGEPIPHEWDETILACLAKEAEQRPQSAREVAQRLGLAGPVDSGLCSAEESRMESLLADDRSTVHVADHHTVELQPASTRKHLKRNRRIALVVGLAALALGILAYALRPNSTVWASAPNQVARAFPNAPSEAPVPAALSSLPASALSKGEFAVTVDPPDVGARLWLGPLSDVEIKEGKALLKDLPYGELELTVKAPGYQAFTTRVTVKDGRGNVEAKLVPVRGSVTVTARPGTHVTAVDERGRETRMGSVPPGGVLDVANLLTVGRYTLKFEHTDCAAIRVPGVELVVGRTIKVAPEQSALPGELRVFSVPSGAVVQVNGTAAGSTPATIKNQPSEQALRVEVFQRGYRRVEQSVTLKPKEARTLNVGTLVTESGGIELRFRNSDLRSGQVAISVDGKPVNVGSAPVAGPIRLDGIEVGSRTVEITHPGYEPWRQAMTVRDQEITAVDVAFVPKPGRVECETTPAGARVVINGGEQHETTFIDGRTKVETLTPLSGALAPGTYTLRFELTGYKTVTRTVTVATNRTSKVSVALERLRNAEEVQQWTVPDTEATQTLPDGSTVTTSTNSTTLPDGRKQDTVEKKMQRPDGTSQIVRTSTIANPDGSKDVTEAVEERDKNAKVVFTRTSQFKVMPDGSRVDNGSVKDEGDRVTITDAAGNTTTVPKSFFRGNDATVYETQYVGGEGQKLTGERELKITLKRDSAGGIAGFDQHTGRERLWDFVIAEAPDTRKFENDGMATRLVFRDNQRKTDFKIEAWSIKNPQGQEVGHFGAQNEVDFKFAASGAYILSVTGETDWGNKFAVSVRLNLAL